MNMSNFISLSLFKKLYLSQSDLLTNEGIAEFKNKLITEEGIKIRQSNGISDDEFSKFVTSLNSSKTILFHDWILQNSALYTLLTKGEITYFEDISNHLKHQFINDYRVFLSPYIAEKLSPYFQGPALKKNEINLLSIAFSYTQLLDQNDRATVEYQLFYGINERIKKELKDAKAIDDEATLIDRITPLCDETILLCVNSMSKASYVLKINFVDDLLSVIKYKSCTPRFANWIIKKLEKITLNKEHEHKVSDLKRELKTGELSVRNHGKSKMPFKWTHIITLVLVGSIGFFIFWVIKFEPLNDLDDPVFANETSFMQFTPEERRKIDSLLHEMNGTFKEDENFIDQGTPIIGKSDQLTIRKNFNNTNLERIYQDVIIDAELREDLIQDSCRAPIAFTPITDTKNLAKKEGRIEAMIKNESGYDVVLVVAEDKVRGAVHSYYIKKGETAVFKINQYNLMLLIPGNEYSKYNAPNNISSDQLPSKKFLEHFCEIDYNCRESINTMYKIVNRYEGKTKFLLLGDIGANFHLIDINGDLEAI